MLTFACDVAPRAGAWIEIAEQQYSKKKYGRVAPRAGAWIEIVNAKAQAGRQTSPLAQGRGLKYVRPVYERLSNMSPLAQGRGLKFCC